MAYDPNIHHRRSIRMKGYDYSQAGLYFITICVQNRDCLFGEIVDDQMMLNDSGEMVKRWYYELENKYPDKRCHEMVVMPNHFHCIIENIGDAHVGAPLRGRPITDERGRPITDERGRPITDERGRPITDERGHPITDERGRPITDERGRPITDERGRPITDERGRPITDERGHPITDERGRPITDEHDHFISDECLRPITDDDDQNNNVSKYGMHNQKYGATIGDAMDWFKTMTTNEYIRNVKTNDWPRFNQKLWQRNYWEHIIRDEKSYDTISEYIINNPQNWETDKLK